MIAAAPEKIGGALPKLLFERVCATNTLDFVLSLVQKNLFVELADFPLDAAQSEFDSSVEKIRKV